jgi:hypothetical protein
MEYTSPPPRQVLHKVAVAVALSTNPRAQAWSLLEWHRAKQRTPQSTVAAQDGGSLGIDAGPGAAGGEGHSISLSAQPTAPLARCSAGVSALLTQLQAERERELGAKQLRGLCGRTSVLPQSTTGDAHVTTVAAKEPVRSAATQLLGYTALHEKEEWTRLVEGTDVGELLQLSAAADTPFTSTTSPIHVHGAGS